MYIASVEVIFSVWLPISPITSCTYRRMAGSPFLNRAEKSSVDKVSKETRTRFIYLYDLSNRKPDTEGGGQKRCNEFSLYLCTFKSDDQDSIAELIASSTTSRNSLRHPRNISRSAAKISNNLGSVSRPRLVSGFHWARRLTLWGKRSAAFSWNRNRNNRSCLRRIMANELTFVELPNCPDALWKCRNYSSVRLIY